MNKVFQQGFPTPHTPHRNDPHSNDLNTDFPLRIGSVAGDYHPGATPMDSADKTVLSMKAATEMGEVRGMHAVPHTLAGVVYCDKDEKSAWDEALKTSKRAMEPGQTRESNPFQCIS